MKTLTVTAARQNLGAWLKRTLNGEDIGVTIDGNIVAFRPVKVYSEDYALQEYGLTEEEMKTAARRIGKEIAKERRRGTIKPFTGKLDALRD
jgi:antitoxin (DNA-binding transcriptional repressor) of toxin-antitoxin stability system